MRYLLGFHFAVALILSVAYKALHDKGKTGEYLAYCNNQYWPIVIASTFGYCATQKNSAFVEMQGSIIFGVYLVMLTLSSFSGLL